MNYAIMLAAGQATERGLSVRGECDVGQGAPKWGWRTEYELVDHDHPRSITSCNIDPTGSEAMVVAIKYER